MKPALLLIVTALICGCKPDARIAQQKTEIAALKVELADVKQKQAEQAENFKKLLDAYSAYSETAQTNMARMTELALKIVAQNSYITNSIPGIVAASKPKPVPATVYAPAKATTTQKPGANSHGVPESVYQIIYAEAVKQWPNNFEMQEFRIQNQVEAYRKLHR